MSDDKTKANLPELADLVAAAEPTKGQKFANFFGLGYGGNTAVAIAAVKVVRKSMPGFVEKWEAKHAKKYFDRKVEELITPIAEKITPEARKVMEDRIAAEAKTYSAHTVDSRLLSTGGFAMLPFQSAKQISDFRKNVKPHLNEFREAHKAAGFTAEQTEDALKQAIDKQKSTLRPGQKKEAGILDGALEEPKFSPLGPEARSDLPKWIVGRVVALGAAFSVQTIVDDRFKKPKAAVDNTLAKIVTRIAHPKGYQAKPAADGAFAEEAAATETPEGVDPKILDVVRMVTTDAYMTTVAIGAHMASMNFWDKKAPDVLSGIKGLQEKFSNRGGPAV